MSNVVVEDVISTKSIIKGGAILITALAWNTAIKGIIDIMIPKHKDTIIGYIIYAIMITIITITIIYMFNIYKNGINKYKVNQRNK